MISLFLVCIMIYILFLVIKNKFIIKVKYQYPEHYYDLFPNSKKSVIEGEEYRLTRFGFASIVVFCIFTFAGIICSSICIDRMFIDEKINVIEEQNSSLINEVSSAVYQYEAFENQTFNQLKPEEIMVAASIYPELQSSDLVKDLIQTYKENNHKLTQLKMDKVNSKIANWLLYFGN